jgi:predicted metal-dependent phosphoesterase TrpH
MPKITKKERLKQIAQRRETYTTRVFMMWKDVMRERVEQTSELVSFKFYRGDLHYHSTYSDGVATVHETKEWIDRAGLDFFFITDHGTVNQKRYCQKYENLWWGQEPGTQYHHLGILGIDRKYTPKKDLVYDYHKVKELGGYPFIPHQRVGFQQRDTAMNKRILSIYLVKSLPSKSSTVPIRYLIALTSQMR